MAVTATRATSSREVAPMQVAPMRVAAVCSMLVALAVALGCGSDGLPNMVPIRGKVTYNDKPLTEGQVVYLPKSPNVGRQATGAISPNGDFVMTTKDKADGVMEGEYFIAIYAYKPHPGEPKTREEHEALAEQGGTIEREFMIPAKYASPAESGLTDTVDGSHSGVKLLELTD